MFKTFVLKVIILIIFLISAVNVSYSKQYDLIETESVKPYNIYVFFNFPSCQSCFTNVQFMLEMVSELSLTEQLNIVLFILDENQQKADLIKESNKLNIEVIGDRMSLFFKYYELSISNSLIVLDHNGFKIDSSSVADSTFLSFLDRLKEFPKSKFEKPLYKVLKREAIKSGNETIQALNWTYGIYSSKYDTYFFVSSNKSELIKYSNQTVSSIFNLQKIFNIDIIIRKISWRIKDSILVISIYQNFVWENKIIEYNIVDDLLSIITIDDFHTLFSDMLNPDDMEIRAQTPFSFIGCPFNQGYIVNFEYRDIDRNQNHIDNSFFQTKMPFSVLDNDLKMVKKFGNFDEKYKKYFLIPTFGANYYFTEDSLFIIQSYSTVLEVFNRNYDLLNRIQLETPKKMRVLNRSLPEVRNKYSWHSFSNSVSYYGDLLIDTQTKNFLIFYRNTYYPEGVVDPFSPEVKDRYFVNIYDKSGRIIQEIELNYRFPRVVKFEGNIFEILHSLDGYLALDTISIELNIFVE